MELADKHSTVVTANPLDTGEGKTMISVINSLERRGIKAHATFTDGKVIVTVDRGDRQRAADLLREWNRRAARYGVEVAADRSRDPRILRAELNAIA